MASLRITSGGYLYALEYLLIRVVGIELSYYSLSYEHPCQIKYGVNMLQA